MTIERQPLVTIETDPESGRSQDTSTAKNGRQKPWRHESIETTLRYYVDKNAKKTAAILWEVHKAQGLGADLGASENSVSITP